MEWFWNHGIGSNETMTADWSDHQHKEAQEEAHPFIHQRQEQQQERRRLPVNHWPHARRTNNNNNNHQLDDDQTFCRQRPLPYENQIPLDLQPFVDGISLALLQEMETTYRTHSSVRRGHMFHVRNNQVYASFATQDDLEWYTNRGRTQHKQKTRDQTKTLWWRGHAWHRTRSYQMLRLIQICACMVQLPDLDGFITFGDGPPHRSIQKSSFHHNNDHNKNNSTYFPYFTFQKRRKDVGILIPYATLAEFAAHDFTQQAVVRYPWSSKQALLFWRGGTSGGPYRPYGAWRQRSRSQFLLACQRHPEWCRAAFYKYTAAVHNSTATIAELEAALGPRQEPVPLLQQLQYRYLLLLHGNGPAAGRTEKYFVGNSLIFLEHDQAQEEAWDDHDPNHTTTNNHNNNEFVEFYYSALQPYRHYLPVRSSPLSTPRNTTTKNSFFSSSTYLVDQVEWALTHDAQAQQIVQQLLTEVTPSLYMDSVACYVQSLLTHYAALLQYNVSAHAPQDMFDDHQDSNEQQRRPKRYVRRVDLDPWGKDQERFAPFVYRHCPKPSMLSSWMGWT